MNSYETLIKRLHCEASGDRCPHDCAACQYGLPPELQDYDTRDLMEEAAKSLELQALLLNERMIPHPSGVPLSKPQCKNLAEFIELHLLADIREDDNIDNIEWVRSMLDAHKKLMEASGRRWNEERECWEGTK